VLICIVAVACRVQLEGNLVKWERWNLRVSFNYREGLVRLQVPVAQRYL
jgi:Cu2+-containing amine oxidase